MIMESHYTPFFQFRVLREQTGDHPAHSGSEHGVEVVKDEFRGDEQSIVSSVVQNVFVELDAGDPKGSSRSFGKMRENERVRIAPLLLPDHDVGEVALLAPLDYVADLEVLAGVVNHVRDRHLQLLQELKDLAARSPVCRYQDLWS